MEPKTRAHVTIFGRVQGVFFRDETRRTAQQHNVDGWVRNLPDGTVEALLEGPVSAVEAVIAWCHKGSPLSRVTEVRVKREAYVGDVNGFSIRR